MSTKHRFDLSLGQQIVIVDPKTAAKFTARVKGVDNYQALLASGNPSDATRGLENFWTSYTLETDAEVEGWGKRFWAVDSQHAKEVGKPRVPKVEKAFYVASQRPYIPEDFEYEPWMSGAVTLSIDGDGLYASQEGDNQVARGVLSTYINRINNTVWAEEVFFDEDNDPQRMVFDALFNVEYH